jgi:hypothetical protein
VWEHARPQTAVSSRFTDWLAVQNRSSFAVLLRVTQKLMPSLRAPNGPLPTPVGALAIKPRSAALKTVTHPPKFVTRVRLPMKASTVFDVAQIEDAIPLPNALAPENS